MKTLNLAGIEITLTDKEAKAIEVMKTQTDCSDYDDVSGAWTQPEDLIRKGYSKNEAAGLWSSLMEKGMIELYEKRSKTDGGDLFVFPYPAKN